MALPMSAFCPRYVALLAASLLICGCGPLVSASVVGAAPTTSSCPNEALRTGSSAGLPDCRAYEQVSPAEKDGQDAMPLELVWPSQAALNGEALGYTDYGAFSGAAGSDSQLDGHLSARSAHGWQTTEITPVKPLEATKLVGYISGYDYSEDLSRAILKVPFALPGTGATPGTMNLFLRSPAGTYTWINAKRPPTLPVEGCASCLVSEDEVAYAGASADFAHVMFVANASLAGGAPEGPGIESLYENEGGTVRYVGVLPDGKPAPSSSEPGSGLNVFYSSLDTTAGQRIEHAISEDGTHVVFQAESDGGAPDAAQSGDIEVYDRIQGRETVELSAPAPEAPAGAAAEPAKFWAASNDGMRVFFTSSAELTKVSNTGAANGGEDLYEYDLQTKALTDLSVDGNPLDSAAGAMVQGVVGASRDGSYVYFVADGQLVEGAGVDGQPNLYVVHDGGRPTFIATLNPADEADWTATAANLTAYVAPDGRHLAFDSVNRLPTANFPTGYDNTDQSTGEPDSEVYEYIAPNGEDQNGELVCASCDAGGARPVGNAFIGATQGRNVSTPLHQPRVLSDSGTRLFFSSSDPLVEGLAPPAAGGHVRVFEYEQSREGGCRTQAACIYLLSPANSPQDAAFLDADSSGDNAFLSTSARLVSSDGDELLDIYDARVAGGFPAPVPASECTGMCRAFEGAPTAPPLLSAAAGPSGNLTPPPATPKKKTARCPRGKHRSHGKCVKTRRNPKRKHRSKRAKKAGRGRV